MIACHYEYEISDFQMKLQQLQILFTSMYYLFNSIIFAEQPLFTNFILPRSEDRDGILSLNWVQKTSVILMIERSI